MRTGILSVACALVATPALAQMWDLQTDFAATTGSGLAENIGPNGAWSYVNGATGTVLNDAVSGWVTGGGPGWRFGGSDVPGINLQTGAPDPSLDLMLGDVAVHAPGNDPNPVIRHPIIIRWTAPSDMTVDVTASTWNTTGNANTTQRASISVHNSSGDELGLLTTAYFDETVGRASPLSQSESTVKVAAGDRIELSIKGAIGLSPTITGVNFTITQAADSPDKWNFVHALTTDTASGMSNGMGRDGAWSFVNELTGAPFDTVAAAWVFGSVPPFPNSPAWVPGGNPPVPGGGRVIDPPDPSLLYELGDVGIHTPNDPVAAATARWTAPANMAVQVDGSAYYSTTDFFRNQDVNIRRMATDGLTVISDLGTFTIDEFANLRATPLNFSSAATNVNAGEHIDIRFLRTPGGFVEGQCGLIDLCVTETDPVAEKWDLAENFSANTGSGTATGIGPGAAWSYEAAINGQPGNLSSPLGLPVPGWITGGGPGWQQAGDTDQVPGISRQLVAPAPGLDLLVGEIAFHPPDNGPDPFQRVPFQIVWTAPADLTIDFSGMMWNATGAPLQTQRLDIDIIDAGSNKVGTISREYFDEFNGRGNPVNIAGGLNVKAGDRLEFNTTPAVGLFGTITGVDLEVCEVATRPDKWDFVQAFTTETTSGTSTGMGRDAAWEVLNPDDGMPFSSATTIMAPWVVGATPPFPGSRAWVSSMNVVPGITRLENPPAGVLSNIVMNDLVMHTAGGETPEPIVVRWQAPAAGNFRASGNAWHVDQDTPDRNHDITVVHVDADGTTELATLTSTTVTIADTAAMPAMYMSADVSMSAGQYLEFRFIRAAVDGLEGFLAASELCVTDQGGVVVPACPCETTGDSPPDVDVFDLLAFLDLWFQLDPGADIDGTPGVNVFDLLTFLECWFPAVLGPCP